MYIIDIIWEVAKLAWEHRKEGLTWATVGSFLWIIVDKMGRKLITNQLKRLFHVQDKSEFKTYVANQARIESKIDAIMAAGGVKWHVEGTSLLKSTSHTGNYSLLSGRMTALYAITAKLRIMGRLFQSRNTETKLYFGQGRKYPMKKKLLSRKFILAVVTALLIILNDGLDLGIDSQTVLAFAGIIATYIVGEAATDVAKAKNTGFDETKTH